MAQKKAAQQQNGKRSVGRPARPMPEMIPDTPENVARIIMSGPPKKKWRFLEKDGG